MNHFTTVEFWTAYNALPDHIQVLSDKAFELLRQNPRHPSLHFKKVGEYWSARVNREHRALAAQSADGFVWFWIGTHEEYERILEG